ncbi:unnamed protein product [Lepeophtheirus salmonis]|uniref:(salmon louse) hypothetical protein n=1 Tax=Lepeophtheirus salmonis TaxID=72036 RepID=A0A7R8CQX3_LEPSM|nr:unnamed protein product [Lepeophtheirus salmonis]CAF2850226.1 unnamed protein product [Lepeophtheirus salmonis]
MDRRRIYVEFLQSERSKYMHWESRRLCSDGRDSFNSYERGVFCNRIFAGPMELVNPIKKVYFYWAKMSTSWESIFEDFFTEWDQRSPLIPTHVSDRVNNFLRSGLLLQSRSCSP